MKRHKGQQRPMNFYCVHVFTIDILLSLISGQCTDGEARLVNGSRPTEGRVEICEGSVWGTVASVVTAFDGAAARVVCRQLGYSDECKTDIINSA